MRIRIEASALPGVFSCLFQRCVGSDHHQKLGEQQTGDVGCFNKIFKIRCFDFISLHFLRVSDLPLEICDLM